jgi:N,N'-diacetyllegionaminate synthase
VKPVFVIAEAGVNHNGDMALARRIIATAKSIGADAVKFQLFHAADLVTAEAPQAEYQRQGRDGHATQRTLLQQLEISERDCASLNDFCAQTGIVFMASAFDLSSVRALRQLGVSPWKIPSGEITNLPYLRLIGSFGQKIVMSTGMATMGEIAAALDALTNAGTRLSDVTVLHCNTEYPTLPADVNLKAMLSIHEAFRVPVGYSDHTLGIDITIAAAALGASVIEKHFTLDRNLPGPDHRASLEPPEFRELVRCIRHVEAALGDGEKIPSPSELKNRDLVRKSIVASREIKAGETFTETNLAAKRPAAGISPMEWDKVIGRVAQRDYAADDFIEW